MILELKLRRSGNSIGLILPKEALAHLGVEEGDTVFASFLAEGALRLSAADPDFARKVQAAEEINHQYGNAIRALIRR
jgi:putative addiction module antidote